MNNIKSANKEKELPNELLDEFSRNVLIYEYAQDELEAEVEKSLNRENEDGNYSK